MTSASALRVVYDATPLGLGHISTGARTGIYRVCERLVAGALSDPRLEVDLAAFTGMSQSSHAEAFCRVAGPAWSARYRHPWRTPCVPQGLVRAAHASGAGVLRHVARRVLVRLARPRPLSGDYDVVHSIYDPLPPPSRVSARVRVLTVHDMCPVLFPHLFEERTNRHFDRIMASIDRRHDRVVCVSNATRSDFLAVSGMAPDLVETIPLAADARFAPPSDPSAILALRTRLGLGEAPYLACLSALGPRKNLVFLLRALAAAIRRGRLGDLRVVLAGPPAAGSDEIHAAADETLRGRIVFPGFLDDADLPAFFAGAIAMVYPSLYEGFGLPPLEAMACGTPTICSRTSSLPEVVGDGGLLVDPTDEDDLGNAIEALVTRPDLRGDLAARALRQAARFSWRACLDRHVDLYRRASLAVRP